ncbi:hypothetical protein GGR92_002371 [Spirosoma lacussanchae]|uniref:hypothetical protein n=1 Tax=Spirosoma lacussanchae TaxID=1884249 RepID=UPI001109A362|nr:hypothetical protein [Spirosoma lacussanchae]
MNNTIKSLQTCRSQHQNWAASLVESEQEIDQLLTLLSDLPNDNYRSLRDYSADYAQALSRLKHRIHHLRADVVCSGDRCASATGPTAACTDPRYGLPVSSPTLLTSLSSEYIQLKNRCHAFLAELMGLNLI